MRERLQASLAPDAFLRHVATLAGATAISQVVLVGAGPVLSRLYTPDAWGVYSLLAAFVAVTSVVSALCYDQAIVGSRTTEDAAALTVVTLVIVPFFTVIAIGAMAVLIWQGWLGFGALPWSSLIWAAVLLLVMQLFMSLRYWHMRAERFGLLGKTAVVQNVGRAVFPMAVVAAAPGWLGLVVGESLGRTFGCLPLAWAQWRETWASLRRQTVASMRGVVRQYKDFAFIGTPSGLLNALAQSLPLPIIAAQFGAATAGEFALAQRVLQAPAALVGLSIADAFHARLAMHSRERPDHLRRFFLRTSLMLLGVSIIPAALVLALGDRGFTWVFGPSWGGVGALALALLPWSTAALVVSPLSRAVYVLGGQRPKLIYDVTAVSLVVASAAVVRRLGMAVGAAVFLLSLGQVVAYGAYYLVLWRLVSRGTAPPGGATSIS